MSLPNLNLSFIRILGLDYRLKPMTRAVGDLAKCRGYIDEDTLEIYVQSDLPPQRVAEVILHECFHALIDGTGSTETDKDTDEKIVTCLGRGMMQFMRDNRDLMDWFQTIL